MESLEVENEELRKEVKMLEEEIDKLRRQLERELILNWRA